MLLIPLSSTLFPYTTLFRSGLGNNFAARIAKITFAVKFADFPRLLGADAVDSGDKICVGDGVGGLLELPQIRSEERRVGKEWRSRWSAEPEKKNRGTWR